MESTLKRTWAEIDLDALAHNYQTLRQRTGARFVGVVKADAYGHGSVQVSRVLEELGADYLAVSSLDEAMELRKRLDEWSKGCEPALVRADTEIRMKSFRRKKK